jgi:hypothetical protein
MPRLYDGSRAEILAHLARTAREAERLREEYGHVSLNLGVESTLFTPGIVPGRWWWGRIDFFRKGRIDFPSLQRRLNAFLERAVAVARTNFEGEITYAAGPWEAEGIDWRQFDYVGLDYYTFLPRGRSTHETSTARSGTSRSRSTCASGSSRRVECDTGSRDPSGFAGGGCGAGRCYSNRGRGLRGWPACLMGAARSGLRNGPWPQ